MRRALLSIFPPSLCLALTFAIAIALVSDNFYLLEILILAVIYAQFAASWDLLSGFTEQDNFGHSFFIGGTAYASAMLNKWMALSPWLAIPIAASLAALAGLLIGALTLRLRGPYFALSTIAFAAVLFKLAFIFSDVTGGEEGLSGLSSFTGDVNNDLLACLAIFSVSFACMALFARSHYGLVLRSTRHNEDAAQASGINTAYYKIVGFMLSGFFAGLGGAMYGHSQMQVNPELLAGSLSVMIVLIATVGGRATLIGPVIAAVVLTLFNEWLRIVEHYRIVIFTAMLIVLVYLNPAGFANNRFFERYPRLQRFLFGHRISR